MLFRLSTTHVPATDLGYLLHKHPAKMQKFNLSFGDAWVFYPEASEDRCEVALTVKRPFTRENPGGEAYVTDLAYAAGSYLPAAIHHVFRTAVNGRCDQRPELAETPIPLDITATPVACLSKTTPEELFEPLGWTVDGATLALDANFPEWGSRHRRIRLIGRHRLSDALRHVCVLLPVLDGRKHHYIGQDEVDKLERLGTGWLDDHPLRSVIVRRYLRFRSLIQQMRDEPEETEEEPVTLQQMRIQFAVEQLAPYQRVVDMGCGEGDLLVALSEKTTIAQIVGVDPSPYAIRRAERRLHLDRFPEAQRRVALIQGAASYPDHRLNGCDAIAMLEVIEHIEPDRLEAVVANIFGNLRPHLIILTTPNRQWNATITLSDLRHRDHRFEWTQNECINWSARVSERYGYQAAWRPIGADGDFGPPTQALVFRRS